MDVVQQVNFIQQLWAPGAVVTTGGYDRESGLKVAEETGQLIGYGMKFLANVRSSLVSAPRIQYMTLILIQPDLPFRLRKNLPLNAPDFWTFYTRLSPKGYTDYPFSEEFLKSQL